MHFYIKESARFIIFGLLPGFIFNCVNEHINKYYLGISQTYFYILWMNINKMTVGFGLQK